MKRDIRDLFKDEVELNALPRNHRVEFMAKLKKTPEKETRIYFWLSIAAVIMIALTVGFSLSYMEANEEEVSPILAQLEAVESEYLENIEKEWQSFVAIADDKVLIERFRKKLDELDKDYQEISIQFKIDANNVLVIEALVDNLQTRLQILEDIQAHIKILNHKNEPNDKSI